MCALTYEDLTIYQWVQGFLAIVSMQGIIDVIRAMLSHMHALFTEASFSEWEPSKCAHGCVLADIEDAKYGWLD
jgi:hypothetical protein